MYFFLFPIMHHRQKIIDTAAVKIGSAGLENDEGHLDVSSVASISRQLAIVRKHIARLGFVSSGAVPTGRDVYGYEKQDDEDLATLQMYASAGQPVLFMHYLQELQKQEYVCVANQVLLTHSDMDSRLRLRNLRRLLRKIFQDRVPGIPIFNENDTVAVKEFKFDNDLLTGDVARLIGAQRVLFLMNAPGILEDLHDRESVIKEIPFGSTAHRKHFQNGTSKNGRGGIWSKDRVAAMLAHHGIESVIAFAHEPDVIPRVLLDKEPIGTRYLLAEDS